VRSGRHRQRPYLRAQATRPVRIALRSALRGSSGWLRPWRSPSIRTGPRRAAATSRVLLQTNPEVGDQFGAALAASFFASDIFNDLAVGAPTETVGGNADAGAVSVFSGPPLTASCQGRPARPWSKVPGLVGTAEAGDLFGAALATGPFDIGLSDLAIGAPFEARSQAFACSGRVTPATLVAFLRRSMGGVRPTLRPPG